MIKKRSNASLARSFNHLLCAATIGLAVLATPLMAQNSDASAVANAMPDNTPRHGIAMHGKPKYAPDFPHFDYVNPDAPKGDILRLAVVANGFDTFNPFHLRGVAAAGISGYLYDTLMESSADEPFSAYGLIAESIETPADRSYVVFNLRPEARFQDGEPITAADVAFSFNTLVTDGHPFFRNYYADVSNVTVESPFAYDLILAPPKIVNYR